MGPKRTGLVLTPYEVRVKAGGFQTTVPLDHIVATSECSAPWWAQAGVHTDFRGHWIINGGPGRLVRLDVSPSVGARILGMRLPVRHLDVGLEDNAGFLAKLSELRKFAGEWPNERLNRIIHWANVAGYATVTPGSCTPRSFTEPGISSGPR